MQCLTRLLLVITGIMACLFLVPLSSANTTPPLYPADADKPPQGGEWKDEFWTFEWIYKIIDTDLSSGHIVLKLEEPLHWTQTWTAHFAGGEFFHTEAISDSVRLAPDGMGQYYTAGTYTSTVFYAGRVVDWTSAEWTFMGIPGELTIEYRSGDTPTPDNSWTGWAQPGLRMGDRVCVYIFGRDDTECRTNMNGIEGSNYIQYRGSFSSGDPTETVALYQIDLEYGIHAAGGMALSILIAPVDLQEWATVSISSTAPASTTLAVDILAPDGTVLLENASDGDSLAGIDPGEYPGLQLRAALATLDPSLTPDIDLWGLSWTVRRRAYLPFVVRY